MFDDDEYVYEFDISRSLAKYTYKHINARVMAALKW